MTWEVLSQPRPTLCFTIYISYLAKSYFDFTLFSIFYGLLAGHISSVLTLTLMVSFVNGST
jgi:hypothetical protein